MIKIESYETPISEISEFQISGLDEKNERTATICKHFILELYGWKFYSEITLNNWKKGVLTIRYAKDKEGFKKLLAGIRNEKQLGKDHPEHCYIEEDEL